jgi:hypothetical protein
MSPLSVASSPERSPSPFTLPPLPPPRPTEQQRTLQRRTKVTLTISLRRPPIFIVPATDDQGRTIQRTDIYAARKGGAELMRRATRWDFVDRSSRGVVGPLGKEADVKNCEMCAGPIKMGAEQEQFKVSVVESCGLGEI